MYVPPIYQGNTGGTQELVRRHPLALLVSNGSPWPMATHVPVISPDDGDLADGVLWGHLNRANPHCAVLARGGPARLVFTGPHGYVTPATYGRPAAAPTWNFAAVHLAGRVEPIEGEEETLAVVTRTAEALEGRFGDRWEATTSYDYFRSILPGVAAFRFHVAEVESMFKLSQEQTAATRDAVARRLDADPSGAARDLAELMTAYGRDGGGAA